MVGWPDDGRMMELLVKVGVYVCWKLVGCVGGRRVWSCVIDGETRTLASPLVRRLGRGGTDLSKPGC